MVCDKFFFNFRKYVNENVNNKFADKEDLISFKTFCQGGVIITSFYIYAIMHDAFSSVVNYNDIEQEQLRSYQILDYIYTDHKQYISY